VAFSVGPPGLSQRSNEIVTAQHNDYTGRQRVHSGRNRRLFAVNPILDVSTSGFNIASQGTPPSMTARIFRPAKNAMQSGRAQTREWQLDYEPEQPRAIEPLMGWTSSGDMKQQLTLHFDSKEEAVAYCERKGIPYQVIEPKQPAHRQVAYADNFAFRRGEPWTH
jgi:ETC complex I subunit conserved region